MLSQDDRRRFDQIVAALRREDPEFAARLNTSSWPRRRIGMVLVTILAWALAPVLIVAAGWIGVLLAAGLVTVATLALHRF
jgi:hypothetical protein